MPNVLVEKKNRTTVLTLNRPERRNALTIELMTELSDALDAANADPTQRVVILRGAGQAFCAGLVMTFLRRQLRERHIRELLFTGDLISVERAREIGLINRVVPPNDLENETLKIVDAVLQNAPIALANTKRLIEELWSSSV